QKFVFVTGEAVLGGVVFKQRGALGRLLWRRLRTLRGGFGALRRRLGTLQEFGNCGRRTEEREATGELCGLAKPRATRESAVLHRELRENGGSKAVYRRDWFLLFINKTILPEGRAVEYRESRCSFQRVMAGNDRQAEDKR